MTEFHDDFTDLLGAYALDAVDPDEQASIEAHLHTCPWCAAEVAQHREVAALLSHSGTDAPDGVWDRIAAELSPPAPPLRMSFSRTGEVDPLVRQADAAPTDSPMADVVPLGARRAVKIRTFAVVVSAAAVLLAVVSFVALDYRNEARNDEQVSATAPPRPEDLSVKLTGSHSDVSAQAVVSPTGKGYLVHQDLPELSNDELYQLWGQVDGVVLSLGTFDDSTEVVNFQVDPKRLDGMESFAITKEQLPGVLESDHGPVLAGDIA